MTAAVVSPGFDVSAVAVRTIPEILSVEQPWKLAFFSTALRKVSGNFLLYVAKSLAEVAATGIEAKTQRLAPHAVFLEGAKELLLQKIALSSTTPGEDLRAQLEKLRTKNIEVIQLCEEILSQLGSVAATVEKPAARISEAVAQLLSVVTSIESSTEQIIVITSQTTEHSEVFQRLHSSQSCADAKLARYSQVEEFDPELVALAESALTRISAKAKTSEAQSKV